VAACQFSVQPPGRLRSLALTCRGQECLLEEAAGLPQAAERNFVEADLTGDGLPELVRLDEERLTVYQDGKVAWRSSPAWLVVSFALGDPNDDGRSEILMALWKQDADGILRSHPFIVGFRGGRYKTIWGGSAVTYGIHELLLADLDGDGRQELIVLESASPEDGLGTTLRTLSVWDWHGWGFNLRWRSETGQYSNLTLVTAEDGDRPQLFVRQCN